MGHIGNMFREEAIKLEHEIRVIMEMAEHSRTMSVGAKILLKARCENMLRQIETIKLNIEFKEHEEK